MSGAVRLMHPRVPKWGLVPRVWMREPGICTSGFNMKKLHVFTQGKLAELPLFQRYNPGKVPGQWVFLQTMSI